MGCVRWCLAACLAGMVVGCDCGDEGGHGPAPDAGGGHDAAAGDDAGGRDAGTDSGVDAGAPDGGGADDAGAPDGGAADDAGLADGGPTGDAGAPGDFDLHAADRAACAFGPGDLTTDTIGPDVPHGDAMPFAHVIILMMENRSFDHYYSALPAYGVADVDVATDANCNPDPDAAGADVCRFHETRYCTEDTLHQWEPTHREWHDGAMDGFVSENNPGGARAMGYYTDEDLPYYYWLSATFAINDRYFSSLLGPTFPNRYFLFAGTSWGRTETAADNLPPIFPVPMTILRRLDAAGRSWEIYHAGLVPFASLFGVQYLGKALDTFADDVAANELADVVFVDPSFFDFGLIGGEGGENDEHPPTNIQLGQQFVAGIVTALMSNPDVWSQSVLFITYDEHGGFYDHVPPPEACVPDDDTPPSYAFDRLGIRVPLIVVSPFARAAFVSHVDDDHTSITRFVENRFDLPAMTVRDANAWPMLDMFDFDDPPFPDPPEGAPSAEPSQAGLDWCENNPPGTGMP